MGHKALMAGLSLHGQVILLRTWTSTCQATRDVISNTTRKPAVRTHWTRTTRRVDLQVDLKQSPLRSTLMMASTWSTFTSTVGQEICALLVPRLPSTLETVLQARLLRFQLTVPTTGIGLLDALKGHQG